MISLHMLHHLSPTRRPLLEADKDLRLDLFLEKRKLVIFTLLHLCGPLSLFRSGWISGLCSYCQCLLQVIMQLLWMYVKWLWIALGFVWNKIEGKACRLVSFNLKLFKDWIIASGRKIDEHCQCVVDNSVKFLDLFTVVTIPYMARILPV